MTKNKDILSKKRYYTYSRGAKIEPDIKNIPRVLLIKAGLMKELKGSYITYNFLVDRAVELHRYANGQYWGIRNDPITLKELAFETGRKAEAIKKDYIKLEKLGLISTRRIGYGYVVQVRLFYEFSYGAFLQEVPKRKYNDSGYNENVRYANEQVKKLIQIINKFKKDKDFKTATILQQNLKRLILEEPLA